MGFVDGPNRAIILVALHAEASAHELHYSRAVLVLALNSPCRIVFVSYFLVSFFMRPISHGRLAIYILEYHETVRQYESLSDITLPIIGYCIKEQLCRLRGGKGSLTDCRGGSR